MPHATDASGPRELHGPTLLVLAAGMGSRFGGLKQMAHLGPSGETVLEYSVYDAIRAGFRKVVFVVRKAFAEEFRAKVAERFSSQIAVDFAFQEMEPLPLPHQLPVGRTKPWGTAHAVLSARQQVSGPFAVINADDFYGPGAYVQAAEFLRNVRDTWPAGFALVAYPLGNTLSPHGTVSRGVCEVDRRGFLVSVTEREKIRQGDEGPEAQEADGQWFHLPPDTRVSMNLMCFTPAVFPFLEEQFREFLETRGADLRAEFYLPAALASIIRRGQGKVTVLDTAEKWMGITYPDDVDDFRKRMQDRVNGGDYPAALWE